MSNESKPSNENSLPKRDRRFRDRNPFIIAGVGISASVLLVAVSLSYDRIPYINGMTPASAYFADAAGLRSGDEVQVAGIESGIVRSIEIKGTEVLVSMDVDSDVELGADSRAAIKTDSILGRRALVLYSEGGGELKDRTIASDRTTTPYALTEALGDLSTTVSDIDTDRLDEALRTVSVTLKESAPEMTGALDGMTRLSRSLNSRDQALKELLAKSSSVTGVLNTRSEQMNELIIDGNTLFSELDTRKRAISDLLLNIRSLSYQLSGLVADNEAELGPALAKLDKVSDLLIRNKDDIDTGLRRIVPYSTALGEAVASGPFFNAYISNLAIGQYGQSLSQVLVPLLGGPTTAGQTIREKEMPGVPSFDGTYERREWGVRDGE